MGLLYHLADPIQHIRNLRRLAGRAVLLYTFTHARDRGFWFRVGEDPAVITKATQGVSWIPHFADVPDLLRQAGFERVEVLANAEVASLQVWDERDIRVERLLLPGALFSLLERARSSRYMGRFNDALRRGVNARYYAYLAA